MKTESVTIKRARLEDASSICKILQQSFIEYKPLYTLEAFKATIPSERDIQNRFGEGPIWIAFQQNIPVGTVSVVPTHDSLLVRSLAVIPDTQGQGLGQLLLKQAEQYAMENQFRRMVLSTTPFLTDAIRLYEKYGFTRTEEGPYDRFGTSIFTMEKILKK